MAIVLIVSQLFESCTSKYICNFLHSCNNQLDFVRGGNSSRAIIVAKTVIKYFLQIIH